jgi:hypothetical protein
MASRSRSPRPRPVSSNEHEDVKPLSSVPGDIVDPLSRITTIEFSTKGFKRPPKSPAKSKDGSAR